MHGSGLDEKDLILFYRNMTQKSHDGFVLKSFFHFFFGRILGKTVDNLGTLRGIENIPHFRFTQRTVLVFPRILIIGMNLNGEVFFRINQLDQNRQLSVFVCIAAEHLGMFGQNLG